jgi:hypothetical protein
VAFRASVLLVAAELAMVATGIFDDEEPLTLTP